MTPPQVQLEEAYIRDTKVVTVLQTKKVGLTIFDIQQNIIYTKKKLKKNLVCLVSNVWYSEQNVLSEMHFPFGNSSSNQIVPFSLSI